MTINSFRLVIFVKCTYSVTVSCVTASSVINCINCLAQGRLVAWGTHYIEVDACYMHIPLFLSPPLFIENVLTSLVGHGEANVLHLPYFCIVLWVTVWVTICNLNLVKPPPFPYLYQINSPFGSHCKNGILLSIYLIKGSIPYQPTSYYKEIC